MTDPQPTGLPTLEEAGLTERERDVLDLALQGLPAREIGHRLFVSEATVRSHLASIYGKLGVSGRVELLARYRGFERLMHGDMPLSQPPRSWGRRHLSSRRLRLGILAAVVTVAIAAFFVLRPDLPPRTTLTALEGEIAADQVAELDVVGSSATITRTDGTRQRLGDLTLAQLDGPSGLLQRAVRAGAVIQARADSSLTPDLLINDILPPLAPPLALVALAIWLVRRRLHPGVPSAPSG